MYFFKEFSNCFKVCCKNKATCASLLLNMVFINALSGWQFMLSSTYSKSAWISAEASNCVDPLSSQRLPAVPSDLLVNHHRFPD